MNDKKEKLLKDTYHKWMQTGLYNLPLEGANDFVDPRVMGYGTASDEKVLSISDYRKLINTQREQAIGLKMSFEVNSVFRNISNKEDSAIFVDEIKAVIIVNGEKQGLFLRMTTVLEYRNSKWIVVHWHGSIPTETSAETDAWLVNEWQRKNEELQNLVDENTSELLNKNKELEIEASLERVRAVAMSMNKSDDLLKICEVSFKEFKLLGFNNLRNAIIHIPFDDNNYFMDYDYSEFLGGAVAKIEYGSHPVIDNYLKQIRKADDAFAEVIIEGSELDGWKDFRRRSGQQDDPRLDDIPALFYYLYSIGVGDIGISTFKQIDESQINILKRFRNVFDLAYRRYTDIAQSEAQAREAQIGLGLERVRARTMAMQRSDELAETATVLFRQFSELGENPQQLTIGIVNETEMVLELWLSLKGNKFDRMVKVPIEEPMVINKIYNAWKGNNKSLVIDISGDELENYENFRERLNDYKDFIDRKNINRKGINRRVIYSAFFSKGLLSLGTLEPRPEETLKLLERFAGVFDLTYTRFLDLQKAEAQTREAQIELALERVRARSMAMHKSGELLDVIAVVSEQLENLGFKFDIVSFAANNQEYDYNFWMTVKGQSHPYRIHVPYINNPMFEGVKQAQLKGDTFYTDILTREENKQWHQHLFEHNKLDFITEKLKKYVYTNGYARSIALLPKIMLIVGNYASVPYSDEENNIIKRFANVFDQVYTRFLDLQRAETQAREAEIELALERVRARTMAMQKSKELKEVIRVVYEQFVHLKINVDHAGFVVDYTPKGDWHFWIADEQDIPSKITHPYFESVWANQFNEAKEKGADFFATNLNFEEKNKFYNELLSYVPGLPEASKDFYFSCPGLAVSTVLLENVGLYIENFSGIPYSDEENNMLMRFGKVFQQTYTRFLDLQKAEAQAREAQIEAALEKVRSRSLAMHKSEELQQVVTVAFERLKDLNISMDAANIDIFSEGSRDANLWIAAPGQKYVAYFHLPYVDYLIPASIFDARENGDDFFAKTFSFEEKNKYFNYLFEHSDFKHLPDNRKNIMLAASAYTVSFAFTKNSAISIHNYSDKSFSEEENNILKRFAKVFEQAYIRFLDLQKAEAQAREAEIQLALERVRARTMAMQHSNELSETASIFFMQLNGLGIETNRLYIGIFNDDSGIMEAWGTDEDGSTVNTRFFLESKKNDSVRKMYEGWKEQRRSIIIDMQGKELIEYINYIAKEVKVPVSTGYSQQRRVQSIAYFSKGLIGLATPDPQPEENIRLLERFAKVFDQTYTRFIDLQKAEAQARESKIEASLERVRAKAMAMHSPNDLSETVNVFFKELKAIGIIPIRCGVGQIDEVTRTTSLTTTTSSQQGDSFQVIGKVKQTGHPVLDGIFENWKLQKEYHPVLEGEDIKTYYDVMNLQIGYPDYPEGMTQYGNNFPFKEGFVFAWTERKLSEEELQIFRRFTSVLSLTYRRYIDLIEAEARAVEAVKQASLDRVRAEIASMRTSEDLNSITSVIWRELKMLDVPFIRCGVFIINQAQSKVQVYLTTPDGRPLGVLDLLFDSNKLTSSAVESWRKEKVYTEHWNKEEFINWTKSMMKLGQVQNPETYQGSSTPPESLDLHFVPFTQGMLYVGDVNPLTDEKLELVRTLAEAFSIAYARYEDFKNLEEAKNKIEMTLSELKSAQAQLIHSEKMASLGELTAGIAHEIKNPLNFVNNFSEVSRELLDEMKTELSNKNIDEVIGLIEDLKQNLEKINQHGKRADSIVKGMLLHSRGTSGERTLTDINDLLDQYVTLAYHGLRAQNKEFNINIEKDYDKTLEKITVVPQDISRVFLNIINNACYAAYDRKKKNGVGSFSPALRVSTKNMNGKVEIRIGDNGNGIPKDILDKIFQPFFTTKPSGEGTGLGLSLSYDIVAKVHGGNIKVESEEGKGAEFIIQLPLS